MAIAAAVIFSSAHATTAFNATTVPAITASGWVRGNNNGDFHCPACGEYEPIVAQLEPANADKACHDMLSDWEQYSDPNYEFTIEYPKFTQPLVSPESEPGLLSATRFDFNQPYQTDVNVANVNFSFKISVWQNPKKLSAEAWANNLSLRLNSPPVLRPVNDRKGIILYQENMGWTTVVIFVAETDRMYEISYFDIRNFGKLVPDETKLCWIAVIDKMVQSFKISRAR